MIFGHCFTKYSEAVPGFGARREVGVAGPLTTEAVVLRSMRYGEADRILHVYTPMRGPRRRDREGRAPLAQPLRRAAGAVLPAEPRAARGPQRPADGDERGDDRAAPAAARRRGGARRARRGPATRSRACSTRREAHPEVFHLLCTFLALLDARPGGGDAGAAGGDAAEAAARRGLRAAAGGVRVVRSRPSTSRGFSATAGGVVVLELRGVGVRDRRADARVPDAGAQPAAGGGAGGATSASCGSRTAP